MTRLRFLAYGLVFAFAISFVPLAGVTSSSTQNFNGTAINGGNTIWFNANLQLTGSLPKEAFNIYAVDGSVSFTSGSQVYTVAIPNATISFDPSSTKPTTTFDSKTGQWLTQTTTNTTATFIAGAQLTPLTTLPGGIKNVTMTLNFTSSIAGVSLSWKWGAAVYTEFGSNSNVGVWPTNSSGLQPGTPTNEEAFLTGGATGGGGSNYTGSFSGSKSVTPDTVMAPEPATWAIMTSMLLAIFFLKRRQVLKEKARL